MNHQDLFEAFFSGLRTGNITHPNFTSELADAIRDSWKSMQEEGMTFVIEPAETATENRAPGVIRLTGTFLYGFEKDGIFHTVPGDLSTQQERTPNETGYFEACLDDTGNVTGIYESLAGNWFGKKPKKKGLLGKLFG